MTKEQFKDDVLLTMSIYIDAKELEILNTVLVNKLKDIEIQETQYLATTDNSNEYYVRMFNAFKGQRLSEKTMKAYNHTLKLFCTMINKPFTQVTSTDIEYFLMKQNCSEVSLNNYRRNLSAFFSWMVKKRIITFNPCNELEPYKEVKKPIDHLNPEDMELIKDGCTSARDRAIVEFLRCTAVRVGEAINVKISDINFNNGHLIVYGEKTKTYRIVMLDKIALGYIRKYIHERGLNEMSDAPLFASRTGKALGDCGYRLVLKKIAENGNVNRRLYPHLFRKSCATSIVRRGGTVGDASDYLGHTENTVTGRHYTFKDDTHVVNIFNRYVATV